MESYGSLIHDEPFQLFVVLGEGPSAEALVSKAGKFAGLESEPLWVVWARRPADIGSEIAALREAEPGLRDRVLSGSAAAFTTSFADEITDVIMNDEIATSI